MDAKQSKEALSNQDSSVDREAELLIEKHKAEQELINTERQIRSLCGRK
jgi:hypothetical protein